MPITLTAISQITGTPTRESNAALLANIAKLDALNPHERLALRVYCKAKEVANLSLNSIAGYDPATAAAVTTLMQHSKTVMGNIPKDDLDAAKTSIDWQNAKTLYGALSTDVETLRGLLVNLTSFSDEELERAEDYLRLEIGA